MKDIDEIWIVHKNGLTLFNLIREDDLDPDLLGGFFSSLNSYLKVMGNKRMNSISLGRSKILLFRGTDDILFISRSHKRIKDEIITNHIKLIEKKFIEQYGNILRNWNGKIDVFERFKVDVEELIKDTPETRAKKSLW